MTWVVGTPTMFGYGFGLSDICVTLADETEVECLQKLHPVGRYVAAGFAGDVEIGFAMIDELRRLCDLKDERLSCDPASIAAGWPAAARRVFGGFSPENQNGGSDIIIISAHPQENTGIGFSPRSYVHIFRSPEFDAEEVPIHKLGSIGSGSSFGPCRGAIERYASDNSHRMMFVRGESTSGGMGSMLGLSLTDILIRTEPRWVSSHLHYCWVYRGKVILKTNDHGRKGRWSVAELGVGVEQNAASSAWAQDADAEHFEMPAIAASWGELVELLDSRGATARLCRG